MVQPTVSCSANAEHPVSPEPTGRSRTSSESALIRCTAKGLGNGGLVNISAEVIFKAPHVLGHQLVVVGALDLVGQFLHSFGIGVESRHLDVSDPEDHAVGGILAFGAADPILRGAENFSN